MTATRITRLRSAPRAAPVAVLIIALFAALLPLATPRVFATDEVQYYVYLRSLRFDGDFDFANDYQRFAELNPRSGIERSLLAPDRIRPQTGLYGNIAPIGAAVLWAPFFFLADAGVQLANALGAQIAADGFSRPYIAAVGYASALYGLLGLLLCVRLARRYTDAFGAATTVITLWLASPLVYYMYIQMPFAHANGFFLAALFTTIWIETRAARSVRAWAALAVVGALLTMTREQYGLFLLLPAIDAIGHYARHLRTGDRMAIGALLGRHVAFVTLFAAFLTPQLAVYQLLNGKPQPAGEVSGKLNLCSPHLIDVLVDFDPRPDWCVAPQDQVARTPAWSRGALLWTPVWLPALVGLVLLAKRDRGVAIAAIVTLGAQLWVDGAFGSTWHLTGAFGFRRLIECTPLFVLGLAPLVDAATRRTGRWPIAAAAGLLVAWNAGLVVNATVFNAETRLRTGLTWPDLWRWQLEAPFKLMGKLGDLLFRRCAFFENGRCE